MQQAAAKHNSTRQHANRLPVHTLKPPTPHTHNAERSAGAAGSTQDCGRKAAASMAACSTAMQLPCSQVGGVQLASQPAQHPKAPHSTAPQPPPNAQQHRLLVGSGQRSTARSSLCPACVWALSQRRVHAPPAHSKSDVPTHPFAYIANHAAPAAAAVAAAPQSQQFP